MKRYKVLKEAWKNGRNCCGHFSTFAEAQDFYFSCWAFAVGKIVIDDETVAEDYPATGMYLRADGFIR